MKNSILFSLFIFILSSCSGDKTTVEETQEEESATKTVKAEVPLPKSIECFGEVEIEPEGILEIYAKANAFITHIKHIPGDEIKKGQELGVLSAPVFATLHKEWMKAEAEYTFRDQQFQRAKKLRSTESISEKDFQQAENEYASSKANYSGLLQELRSIGFSENQLRKGDLNLSLTSPFNGYIVEVNVNNGKHVDEQTKLFTVIDPSKVHLSIQLPLQELEHVGEESQFYFVIAQDTLKGQIIRVNKLVNSNNTVTIHGHLSDQNDSKKLSIGQRLLIRFPAKD